MADHVHEPVLIESSHIVYVPVLAPPSYGCATCDAALFVIPTPEEADEYDRVLEADWEQKAR